MINTDKLETTVRRGSFGGYYVEAEVHIRCRSPLMTEEASRTHREAADYDVRRTVQLMLYGTIESPAKNALAILKQLQEGSSVDPARVTWTKVALETALKEIYGSE